MKILILSASTGEGHNSSGKAILNAMLQRGIDAEMKDVLEIANPRASKKVSKTYVKSTEGHNLFSKIYALAVWVSEHLNQGRRSPVYLFNKIYWRRLYRYLEQGGYDAVVSVHLFAAESLTAVKREGKLRIPTFFVMTDYTLHAFLNDTDLDYYIIPHEDLIPVYTRQGFKFDHIFPIGIPVDVDKFTTRQPKPEARKQVAEQLGFKLKANEGNWYLVMSGSMGFGNMSQLMCEFISRIGKNDRVICVCGRNERNLHTVQRDFAKEGRVVPVGYTDKVSLLMDACDVVLSKPGGITTTETIIKNIPLVHTAPIPGIESENAEFCHERNMSFYAAKPVEQVEAAIRLATDSEAREAMLESQRRNSEPKTCQFIIDLVMHTLEDQAQKENE
ncbi:MAG: hypothetical protein IJS92_04725 [Paludibacteraceae bacterium]|nr:hypothetical protein [Paludibacteraceae bacterium]